MPNLASDAVEPTEEVQVNTSSEAEKLTTDRIVKAEKLTTTKPDVPHFLLCPSVSNMISVYWLGLRKNIIYLKNILPADFSDCRRGYHEKAGGGLLANSTATYYPIILQGWLCYIHIDGTVLSICSFHGYLLHTGRMQRENI